MKKFKTRTNIRKIKLILLLGFFLIIFIIVSFCKLSNSYYDMTSFLLKNFGNNDYNFNFLTSNLDNLINTYSFHQTEIVYNNTQPTIYLYNTHDQEKYSDNKTIYDATKLLKNNLMQLGIKVIQEENKPSDYLNMGISYYDITRSFIKDKMNNERDIEYYIDIHRDSATDTLVTINNKPYAKILFVLGLENKNYEKNKIILNKMNDFLNSNYPGLSKGIYEKKGSGVDGVYNQDLGENVLLIEIGGIKNNIEEVNNSTEIIALMLYHMLGD